MKVLVLCLVMLSCWAHARPGEELVLSQGIADNCNLRGDFLTCLQLMMLANVSDMAKAEVYQLTDSLVVEKVNDLAPLDLTTDIQRLDQEKDVNLGNALLVRKVLDTFRSHVLHWRVLPDTDLTVFRHRRSARWDLAVEQFDTHRGERTFGARRRIVMVMLPIMYKLGVITAMLAGLTILTLKGVTIGVILLVLAFGNVFKSKAHYPQPSHWAPHHPGPTDLHVHVHTDKEHAHSTWEHQEYQHHPYRRYEQMPYPYSFGPTSPA